MRRRTPLELRRLRDARASGRLRHQRFGRDSAQPVGMGREAPRRELHPCQAWKHIMRKASQATATLWPSMSASCSTAFACAISRSRSSASAPDAPSRFSWRPATTPIFLQVKKAGPLAIEPHAGKSLHSNHGERVAAGQRLMQSASDLFLGWGKRANGRDFYVRQ